MKTSKKVSFIPQLQKPLYDNCQLLDSDGHLLSTCNKKKVQWYADRGLGTVLSNTPLTLQLNFTPKHKDRWTPTKLYYCHEKKNICVVCGSNESLSRKYIVPAEYRKFLEGTSHSCHDILLFCRKCHVKFGEHQQSFRKSLCFKYVVAVNDSNKSSKFIENAELKKVYQAARTLQKHRSSLPESRIKQLSKEIMSFYNLTELAENNISKACSEDYLETNDVYEPHGKQLIQAIKKAHTDEKQALQLFEKSWRQHFVENMKPQHLPRDWSTDHGHSSSSES